MITRLRIQGLKREEQDREKLVLNDVAGLLNRVQEPLYLNLQEWVG